MADKSRGIKTGIIGYGYAGRVLHRQLIQAAEGLELCAVTTSNPERRAQGEQDNLRVYHDVDQLLDDPDIELVVIATPHDSHGELSIKALESGKHVVTDKIMCLTTQQADAMLKAARENRRMLSVFHNRRWDGDFLTVCKYIDEGTVGKPTVIRSYIHSDSRPRPGRWRSSRAKGGGILSDWGAHLIDQALLLNTTKVVSVYCDIQYSLEDVDVETWALCTLTFEDGARHVIETVHNSHQRLKGFEVWGDRGKLICKGFDPQEAALRKGEVNPNLPQDGWLTYFLCRQNQPVQELKALPGNWTNYYRNIARHLLLGEELAVKPEQAKRVVQVREAALLSAETRQIIGTRI